VLSTPKGNAVNDFMRPWRRTERLFDRSELKLDAPAKLIQPNGRRVGERLLVEHIGQQVHDSSADPYLQMPKHQRGLPIACGCLGSAIDNPLPLADVTQLAQQRHVGPDPDQKRVVRVDNRFPKLVAGKAGIAAREDSLDALAGEMIERKALDVILDSAEYEEVPLDPAEESEPLATVETQAVPGEMQDLAAEAVQAAEAAKAANQEEK
jgi:hypothetical protein